MNGRQLRLPAIITLSVGWSKNQLKHAALQVGLGLMRVAHQDAWRTALFAAVVFVIKAIFSISNASIVGKLANSLPILFETSDNGTGNLAVAFLSLAAPQFLVLNSPGGHGERTAILITFSFIPGCTVLEGPIKCGLISGRQDHDWALVSRNVVLSVIDGTLLKIGLQTRHSAFYSSFEVMSREDCAVF